MFSNFVNFLFEWTTLPHFLEGGLDGEVWWAEPRWPSLSRRDGVVGPTWPADWPDWVSSFQLIEKVVERWKTHQIESTRSALLDTSEEWFRRKGMLTSVFTGRVGISPHDEEKWRNTESGIAHDNCGLISKLWDTTRNHTHSTTLPVHCGSPKDNST